MNKKLTFRLLAFYLIFTTAFGYSAIRTWTGGTSNNWNTGSNWTGNSKPTSSDDVILNGTGTFQPTTNISGTIRSLSINGGSLTLTGSLSINNYVIFYKGIINTTITNLLIFKATATVSGASDSSHVNGPVRKIGNAYGSFTFPTGDGIYYAPIGVSSVSNGSNADYFTAEYFRVTAPYNLNSKDVSLNNISVMEYWNLVSNDLNAVVTLSFKKARSGSISNLGSLKVAGWDGSTWKNRGGSASGSTSLGTVSSSSVLSTFGPFAISSSSNLNPLPVELIEFSAVSENNNTNLSWTTASEENLHTFEVCRSTDGHNYIVIGQVNAIINSNNLLNYSFTDLTVNTINSPFVYYRLKMIDIQGSFKLSHISQIRNSVVTHSAMINIYPNPTTEFVNVALSNIPESDITINVVNNLGQTIQTYFNPEITSTNTIMIDVRGLENGIYFINIVNNDGSTTSNKFIKR